VDNVFHRLWITLWISGVGGGFPHVDNLWISGVIHRVLPGNVDVLPGSVYRVRRFANVVGSVMSWNSGLYDAEYRRRRKLLFASKSSDSVCWRCGEPERLWDRFQAGHLVDGSKVAPLGFEHRSCNQSAGGRAAHRVGCSPASKDWTR